MLAGVSAARTLMTRAMAIGDRVHRNDWPAARSVFEGLLQKFGRLASSAGKIGGYAPPTELLCFLSHGPPPYRPAGHFRV